MTHAPAPRTPARAVARRVGAPSARTVRCAVGVSQQEVINHALPMVAAGRADTVVVAGSEARAWARNGGLEEDHALSSPDWLVSRSPDFVAPIGKIRNFDPPRARRIEAQRRFGEAPDRPCDGRRHQEREDHGDREHEHEDLDDLDPVLAHPALDIARAGLEQHGAQDLTIRLDRHRYPHH